MPIGVFTNCLAVVFGGLLGAVAGERIPERYKENLNMIFGCCAMGMGVYSIVMMTNMPAVICAMIIGTCLGMVLHFGERIYAGAVMLQKLAFKLVKQHNSDMPEEDYIAELITAIVLFCASGTGIYGSIVSGMTGDHTILFSKSILDLFTALIFACSLGVAVSMVAVPQAVIFLILFYAAGMILPLTNEAMIADFKACGGFIMLATGFRMIKVKMFPIADMIPAMILVMPFSALWQFVIVPLL